MKKMKAIYLVAVLAVSALLLSSANAWAVSEEAQRHFDRGMAAVEMAKSPDDYAPAIKEFEQAIRLAPEWPEAYYNLGIAQEKAGKYSDAITSLRQYLRLAPNASDAATVKSLVNKLEFKAEQTITDEVALDIFGSLAGPQWEIQGTRCKWDVLAMKGFRRVGHKILYRTIYQDSDESSGRVWRAGEDLEIDANVIGRKLDYTSWYTVYHPTLRPPATRMQAYETKVELEIMSRTKVKAKGKTTFTWDHSVVENCNYEYIRK